MMKKLTIKEFIIYFLLSCLAGCSLAFWGCRKDGTIWTTIYDHCGGYENITHFNYDNQ